MSSDLKVGPEYGLTQRLVELKASLPQLITVHNCKSPVIRTAVIGIAGNTQEIHNEAWTLPMRRRDERRDVFKQLIEFRCLHISDTIWTILLVV
jgi:hypothetical protein